MRPNSSILGAVIGVLFVSLCACSKDNSIDQSTTAAGVGNACGDPEDDPCASGSACVLGFCRYECASDEDCEDDTLCIGGGPYGCSLAWDLACSSSSPCREGLGCDDEGKCRDACDGDGDCGLQGYHCRDEVCVPD